MSRAAMWAAMWSQPPWRAVEQERKAEFARFARSPVQPCGGVEIEELSNNPKVRLRVMVACSLAHAFAEILARRCVVPPSFKF